MSSPSRRTSSKSSTARLSDADLDYNLLYIACILQKFSEKFIENGAVVLNHMLQERGGLTKEQAFAVVADALKSGIVKMDKKDKKRLYLVPDAFRPFRDRMIHLIGRVQAEVVTFSWNLRTPRKGLSAGEQKALQRQVRKGRLWDMTKAKPERLAEGVFSYFDKLVDATNGKGRARIPDENERHVFMEIMQLPLERLANKLPTDFVLMVTMVGSVVKPRIKMIDRSSSVADPE